MTTISSRDFNQDVGRAKRAARLEPVFITDRGRPSHVLMSFDTYRQMSGQTQSIVDLLAMDSAADSEPEFAVSGSWDQGETF